LQAAVYFVKLSGGEIKPMPPFSPEILTKILKGADKTSSRLRDDCWLVLDAQGLIPK
jgi:hypothetical protein